MGEARLLLVAIGAGFVFTLIFALMTRLYAADAQAQVADSILRFHVVANSDSEADQALKLLVRDAVLEEYHEILANVDDRVASVAIIRAELENIETIAAGVVSDVGFDYNVDVKLSNQFFPTRAYGGLMLPPGMYDALTIRIGSASGQNWWCVMFPPLCFVDETQAELSPESREQFAAVLDDRAYELVSSGNNNIHVRFAVVEWWQNRADSGEEELLFVQYHVSGWEH